MATTRQELYTGALYELGSRKVLTTESAEARRALDDVYDRVIQECLEAGSWNFAMETIKAVSDTGNEPAFGYTEVFAKPSDWVSTYGVSLDENFTSPLIKFSDEGNRWSASSSPVYVRYVSNDTGLGLDLNLWTRAFSRYVELELASRVCMRLTSDKSLKEYIDMERDKARTRALNKDAMNEAQPKFRPVGPWTRSRWGNGSSGNDRGNRGSLIG